MSSSADAKMPDALDAITTALQQGDDDIEGLISQSAVPRSEVESLAGLIQSLQAALRPIEPSAEFAEGLEAQLMDTRRGMVMRVRQMPARVHIAALLAVAAGFGLIAYRRIAGADAPQDISEEPLAV